MTEAAKVGTLEPGNAIPLLRTLGIRLTEVGERHAVKEVDVDDRHRNYYGGGGATV
jgi:acyl-coenzyme A thioesterase PaaI-like protein